MRKKIKESRSFFKERESRSLQKIKESSSSLQKNAFLERLCFELLPTDVATGSRAKDKMLFDSINGFSR